jgi:hypothetical protein
MDNDTLKARGTFFAGLGVLLLGAASIVWSISKVAETIYFRKFMASGTWPSEHVIGGERSREWDGPSVIPSNGTVAGPVSGSEQPTFYSVEVKKEER